MDALAEAGIPANITAKHTYGEFLPLQRLQMYLEWLLGRNAELTLLPGMGHNEGIEYAYEHTDVTEWLISMRRTDHTPVPEFLSEYF